MRLRQAVDSNYFKIMINISMAWLYYFIYAEIHNPRTGHARG